MAMRDYTPVAGERGGPMPGGIQTNVHRQTLADVIQEFGDIEERLGKIVQALASSADAIGGTSPRDASGKAEVEPPAGSYIQDLSRRRARIALLISEIEVTHGRLVSALHG